MQKQKHPEDSADMFFQPPNSNSVGLQQEVRLIVYSVLGVHGCVSLTCYSVTIIAATFNLLFCDNHCSHTMKCCVCTKVICSYASTIKLVKKRWSGSCQIDVLILVHIPLLCSKICKIRYLSWHFVQVQVMALN